MRTIWLLTTCIAILAVLLLDGGPASARGGAGPRRGRLASERSPYLRQHATNPVDWYPWGDAAFAEARRRQKPIFLSIGYAACHWCHVMEHESFEDRATADVLNDAFVCIKVDREERPDLDRYYMNAVMMMTGRGGWPMTVVLTPDGKPFWGGTYLTRGALQKRVQAIQRQWRTGRASVLRRAESYARRLAQTAAGPRIQAVNLNDKQLLAAVRGALARRYDPRQGGYRSTRKFPPHAGLLFFLEDGASVATDGDRAWVKRTLDAMSDGGLHDQVGGGWHRYTVDAVWLVPHFEKMLYDNALLVHAYARMYGATKAPRYRRAVDRALAWIERDLKRPAGGYASSLDADTNGHEGTTYLWSTQQLRAALPGTDYAFARDLFGASRSGNFKEAWWKSARGQNVLHLPAPLRTFASRQGLGVPAAVAARDRAVGRLLTVRTKRPQPALDDKVITSWNGLLLSGLAVAGAALREPRYVERARALARFLLASCRRPDGTLLRFPRGSGAEIVGFGEDHAFLIDGLLDLALVDDDPTWRNAAFELGARLLGDFEDKQAGGFFASAESARDPIIARDKPSLDRPIPSMNGAAIRVCLRLAGHDKTSPFAKAANRGLALYRNTLAQGGRAQSTMGLARALAARVQLEAKPVSGLPRLGGAIRQDVVSVAAIRRVDAKGAYVDVHVTLDEGWHVNAATGVPAGYVPTQLTTRGAKLLTDVSYPSAVTRTLGGTRLPLLEGTFVIRARLGVAARGATVPLVLTLQPCDEHRCKDALTIRLDVP